jgi:hypothetical protein
MISPLLTENESPCLRYRQPEFDGDSMTMTNREGSALFETWEGGLLYTIIHQNDVPFLEKYIKITPSILRHIDSLPTYYDPFYVAVENGSLDGLKTLLAHYPTVFGPTQEINFRDRGFILLDLAAEYAHIEITYMISECLRQASVSLSRAGLGRAGERGTLQAEYGLLLRIGTAGRSGSINKT